MTEDEKIIQEATEAVTKGIPCAFYVPLLLDVINRQKAEIERYKETVGDLVIKDNEVVGLLNGKEVRYIDKNIAEIFKNMAVKQAKSEAYREFADKITEVFMRYAHIHQYAEGARRDYIEAVDGTNIEMQSVWDVCTLEKNGMAEYEEMGRLQNNIEMISKERLLTELEKDFQLLVNELTRNLHGTCTEK